MQELSILLLPLSMAYIMLTLGLSLKPRDFTQVIRFPKAFLLGIFNQLCLLPALALVLVLITKPEPTMAFGIMLISFCPAGITSNLFTQYARGNLALSISLTATTSLISIMSVPLLVAFAYGYFLSSKEIDINVLSLGTKLLLISLVPVVIGMVLNEFKKAFVSKIIKPANHLANLLFAIIVISAISSNWQALINDFMQIGWLLIILLITLFIAAISLCRMLKLNWFDTKTIAIETGFQNGAFTITLASLIGHNSNTIPEFALPAVIYSVLMNFVSMPFILWFRAKS